MEKNKKRILILANNDTGLYRFRKEIIEEYIAPGTHLQGNENAPCQVYVSTPVASYAQKLEELGCQIIPTEIDRRGTNPIADSKILLRYIKMIRRIKPDLVLTYTIKPNIYGGIACRLTRTPYFTNITGLGTSVENAGLLAKIAMALYWLGTRKARCIFFQNSANMAFMHKNRIGRKNSVLIPGSGVDLCANTFEAYPEETGQIRFLMVGRVMRDKGFEEYLACAKQICTQEKNISFTMVGGMEENRYQEALDQASADGYMTYLGRRSDVHQLMADHHCIINPSYHEGMSNVLLEAAACGRPVLASNVPGCRETFDEGISGLGFEARNSEALIECVKKFMSLSYAEKAQMGANGRKKVESGFDRKLVIAAYQQESKKILEAGK